MTHLSVPWTIESGKSPVSGVIMRRQTYAANRGIEGVVGPLDCRVIQTPTASGNVLLSTGGYVVNAKKAGSIGEAYAGYVNRADASNSEDLVPIAPNNTSSVRYDLVMIRVENPFVTNESWQLPTDQVNGPYVFTRVLQGVAATTRQLAQTARATDTAFAVALIAIPANTQSITDAMITDLRPLAGTGGRAADGRIEQTLWPESILCSGGDILYREDTAFKSWPAQATAQVPIPAFATGVDILQADVVNGLVTRFDSAGSNVNAYVFGEMRLNIGGSVGTPTPFDMNVLMADGGGGERRPFFVGGTQAIPAALRGTVATVKLEARMYNSNGTGHLQAKNNTRFRLLLSFTNKPSYS